MHRLGSKGHLRTRILSTLLIPVFALGCLSVASVIEDSAEGRSAGELVTYLELAVLTGNTLHETQTERGLTGLFLNSKGASSGAELEAQRTKNDKAIADFNAYLGEHGNELPADSVEKLDVVKATLGDLAKQREAIIAQKIDTATAIAWYTALNSQLLDAAAALAASSPNAQLQREATSYVALLNAKEQVGIERARLAVVFANDKFATGQLQPAVSAVAAQKSYLSVFASTANDVTVADYDRAMQHPDVAAAADMEKLAFDKAGVGGFGVDSKVWFRTITHKIELIAEVERGQGERLIVAATDVRSNAQRSLLFNAVLSLIAVVASIALGWLIATSVSGQVSRSARNLRESSDQLARVGISLGASAEETAAQARIVTSAGEHVSGSVDTVAAAVEEMNASIGEIAHNTSDAASAALEAVRTVEATNATISKLGESSAEIGRVLDVITSIAEQTNLLALNATIEAARAGDQGKGFAVVANEVKELAKETARATEEIASRIAAIQNDTHGAVDAISKIGDVVDRINEIQTSIAGAVEQQTAAVGEIARNINEAAVGSSEIANNISSVAVAAVETSEGAQAAQHAGDTLALLARRLQELVEGSTHRADEAVSPSIDEFSATASRRKVRHRARFGADRNDDDVVLEHA